MHVLFVHKNFPGQFGHIARWLVEQFKFRCTFASEAPPRMTGGIERIQYQIRGGATKRTHYCSRTFENQIWHSHALFEALSARPDIRPDLIVGHSGFASTLFLRELYDCPIINYFEYFYRPSDSDMDFRSDFPPGQLAQLRARARNAMLLLDLENCDAGYSPTQWQRSRLPKIWHNKVRTLHDGIDVDFWRPVENAAREVGNLVLPDDKRIVTYVSRGMESMRGFDIFMKMAKRVCDMRSDVLFLVVGEDRVAYGGDMAFTGGKTFKEWVLSQDDYDLSRILFLGRLAPSVLAHLFSLADLHVYLTVPFVLSWSLMNALACGATVLASSTAPVLEMIEHEHNGLLVDFFDLDRMVQWVNQVLDNPSAYQHLGRAGAEMIRAKYSQEKCLPRILDLFTEVAARS